MQNYGHTCKWRIYDSNYMEAGDVHYLIPNSNKVPGTLLDLRSEEYVLNIKDRNINADILKMKEFYNAKLKILKKSYKKVSVLWGVLAWNSCSF
jgi:hypothetical protein